MDSELEKLVYSYIIWGFVALIFLMFFSLTIWLLGCKAFATKLCYFLSLHWVLKKIIKIREGPSIVDKIKEKIANDSDSDSGEEKRDLENMMNQSQKVKLGKNNKVMSKVEIKHDADELKELKLRIETLQKDFRKCKENDVFEGKDGQEEYLGSNNNMKEAI